MRKLLIFCAVIALANAVTIRDIKTEVTNNAVDMILTFDAPFNGKVINRRETDRFVLEIANLSLDAPRIFSPRSDTISQIRVTPNGSGVEVIVTPKTPIDASVLATSGTTTSGAGSMRLRFAPVAGTTVTVTNSGSNSGLNSGALNNLGVDRIDITKNYIYMGIFVAVLILFWIIIKLLRGNNNSSWLIGKNRIDSIHLIQQKTIDPKNKIVQINFKGINYLLLVGESGFLIDRLEITNLDSQSNKASDFENLLQENSAKLEEYLATDKRRIKPRR